MKAIRFYLPGVLLILAAAMIVMVPRILVAFIAALLVAAGIGMLHAGHIIRRSAADAAGRYRWYSERDLFRRQLAEVPLTGRWFRYR